MKPVIFEKTEIRRGLYLRSPFYYRYSDDFAWPDSQFEHPLTCYARRYQSIRYFLLWITYLILNGNAKARWVEIYGEGHDYGFRALRSPIYTQREYRSLTALVDQSDSQVVKVVAEGWNYIDEPVGGRCETEHVVVYLKNGNKQTWKNTTGNYKYTYPHLLEGFMENGWS